MKIANIFIAPNKSVETTLVWYPSISLLRFIPPVCRHIAALYRRGDGCVLKDLPYLFCPSVIFISLSHPGIHPQTKTTIAGCGHNAVLYYLTWDVWKYTEISRRKPDLWRRLNCKGKTKFIMRGTHVKTGITTAAPASQ